MKRKIKQPIEEKIKALRVAYIKQDETTIDKLKKEIDFFYYGMK